MASNTFHLAVMPGEGIGPEVMAAAHAVLVAVERRFGLAFRQDEIPGGAHHYRETGAVLPPDGMDRAAAADAVLFGAMGWPDIRYPDGTEIAPQLDLRFTFGLYAGVRPIRAIPGVPTVLSDPRAARIDLVIVRESTEGMFASRGRGEVSETEARDTQVITRATTERLTHFSCDLARRRKRERGTPGRVTLVDKANVFRSFAFMRQVFHEAAAAHPDVEAGHHYVDAMALDLVRRPWDFDVLPTENLFGDILSDLGAGLVGGMGFAPSADIGDRHAVFQPSHGTAPDIAGKGIANPTGMILSTAMMLDWLGEIHGSQAARDAARAVEGAVDEAFDRLGLRTYDIGGRCGTRELAEAVAGLVGAEPAAAVGRRAMLGAAVASTLALPFAARPARAEATRLRVARQFGVGYAQLLVLEDQRLVEKHAAAAGLGAVEVTWSTFRSSDVMNDGLLSGTLDIASLGVPGLGTIWDKTAGARFEVKGLLGLNTGTLALVTREPDVRTLADYRPGMKIAVPAVKVSNQAIFLQMAAAKLWGPQEYARLDPLTLSMAHPDALAALLSNRGEVGSYFGSPPFLQRALKAPGVRQVVTSVEILGAPTSFNVLAATSRFHTENPRLVAAFVAAMEEATAAINADIPAAAAAYARITGDKTPAAELAEIMTTGVGYTLDLQGTLPILQFMAGTGVLKRRPQSWTEYMLPSALGRGGS